ncbi:MAG TPA: phosphatase PAP2 family protein [Gaiellaceae bacterium]|nr:phosphatase PAP2 family protein [Gaiellaceae bacterium]
MFVGLSQLGDAGLIWLLLAAALTIGWRRPGPLVLTSIALLGAGVVANALKLLSGRTRPYVAEPEPPPLVRTHLDLTFPSGHSATSFAAALVLALVIGRRVPAVALFALAAGVAWSRVYVGVHYPSDVLLGSLLGLAIGGATFALAPRVRALRRPAAVPRRSRRAPPPG